jgi:GNAT superfamily N-acetyltransferase
MSLSFTLSDLRQRPEFFDTVADRIWQAWWRADGYPLDYISGRLRENMDATPIPFALVAHDGEAFLGTASVIVSDLAERPQWTPWVAAVWVELQSRGRGIGGALVNRATLDCFALGVGRAYLCARPQFKLLRKTGLACDRTGGRTTSVERIYPRRQFRSRQTQFAAMKIERPKPVRWCSA